MHTHNAILNKNYGILTLWAPSYFRSNLCLLFFPKRGQGMTVFQDLCFQVR